MGEKVVRVGKTINGNDFILKCQDQLVEVDVVKAKELWEGAISCLMK